jgi:hypothetical protein
MRNYRKRIFIVLPFIVAAVLYGCKKEDVNPVTEDDAADAIAMALESGSSGYAQEVSDAAAYSNTQGYGKKEEATLQCGTPFDTTIVRNHTGSITATYSHSFSYLLHCNALDVPQSISFTGTYSGNYDGTRMFSTNTGTRTFTLTGLELSNAVYTFNGATSRTGTSISKVRSKNTFTSNIALTATDVLVDKSTKRIQGGTGTANITCTSSSGKAYAFSGIITFNTNNTATLIINGNTYTIDLY